MRKSGFSMIELVFVIVILGVLAAVAVPKFASTRTDAQVAMARSDIATILKSVPARVFAENIDTTASTPPSDSGATTWGEWIIDTAGLDRGRWTKDNGNGGIKAVDNAGGKTANCDNITIAIKTTDPNKGDLEFNPHSSSSSSKFCQQLAGSYPTGSNRIIKLTSSGAIKF